MKGGPVWIKEEPKWNLPSATISVNVNCRVVAIGQ